MIKAETFFKGPHSLLDELLAADRKALRLYNRLYEDRLVCSTTAMVDLASLYCTQGYMDPDAVAEYVAQPRTLSVDRLHCVSDLPVVVAYAGALFVLDGHHRLASKKVCGLGRAKVYLWNLNALMEGC